MEVERQHLEDMVQLLQSVQWLHNFPLTEIFTRNVFHQMPEEWREVLFDLPLDVLNGIPQCTHQTDWPPNLQNILEECRRLSVHQLLSHHPDHSDDQDIQIPQEFVHKVSAKKKHEVAGVVRLVKSLAEVTGSGHVLDIGSGMGYIDSCLHEVLKLSVLGAESNESLVSAATERQTQLSGQCQGVRHLPWSLADDDATLDTAREVIDNLVHLKQPCTCHVKGRGHGLDNKQSAGGVCCESLAVVQGDVQKCTCHVKSRDQSLDSKESVAGVCGEAVVQNDVQKCTSHVENKAQGLEFSQTSAVVSGGLSEETALTPIHEYTSQIKEHNETEACQYDENLRSKSSETEACQSNGNLRSKSDIFSMPCVLGPCSAQALSNSDNYPRNSCMLLGLHACADLSPIMMKMFTACTQLSSLVLLSCCYHKLQPCKQDIQTSDAMKQDIQTSDATKQYIQASDATKDIQASDAAKQYIQASDATKQDIQASDATKQYIQASDTTKQDIQTSNAMKQDIQTSDATKQNIQISDATPHKEERRLTGSFEHGDLLGADSGSHVKNSEGETPNATSAEFVNFPMSQTLSAILKQHHFGMTVFGLRVGAQESGLRWLRQTSEHHEYHWKNVAYRGLLEVFCQHEGLTLKKRRRRCVRKSQFGNLQEYTEKIKESYEFEKIAEYPKGLDSITGTPQNSEETPEDFQNVVNRAVNSLADALQKEYENHKHLFPLIEPLTGLQLALQPVIEGLVLLDYVAYLKECGFEQVWLEKVFEDELSPRNIALVAVR